uniref:Transporter n=1 Tax=Macrostomum lignano TaxID=282301 RepID=A0A1I8HNQ3_9PLAT
CYSAEVRGIEARRSLFQSRGGGAFIGLANKNEAAKSSSMSDGNSDLAKIVDNSEEKNSQLQDKPPLDCGGDPPGKKYKGDDDPNATTDEKAPIARHPDGDKDQHVMNFEVSYPPGGADAGPEGGERAEWGNKVEFLLTCVGYAVGLGNVWRFPYLCYKNGGGAFLLPYCLMLVVVGLPCFFMELSFGQFASVGPLTIWRISPLFKGLGYSMVMVSLVLSVYYNVIVAQCLFFLASSLQSRVPWADCGHSWNSWRCREFEPKSANSSLIKPDANSTGLSLENGTNIVTSFFADNCSFDSNDTATKCRTPAEEFYEDFVLKITDGIDQPGEFNWLLTLALLAAWIIVAVVLIKGIQSLGKVSYFTASFPYIMLSILLIRGATLPGSLDGVIFYVKPEWSRLKDYKVWMEAATQIFFNLSCCNGGLIAMSSYNKFRNNCQQDAIFVAVVNALTSVFAGFVIFCNLGFMAHQKQLPVADVAKGGPGLAFIVYPEALTHLPLTPMWAVLFFIMMATLGFGSQFSIVETVLSAFQDEMRVKGIINPASKLQAIVYRVAVCAILFIVGLSMMYGGGMFLLNLIDNAVSTFPLLVCGFMELFVIMFVYGYDHFAEDIKMMVGGSPNIYWRATWKVVTPVILVVLILIMAIFNEPVTYGDYVYAMPFQIMSHLIGVFIIMWIPGYYIYKYCREGGFVLMKEFHKPAEEWGPAQRTDREEFLENLAKRTDSMDGGANFYQSKLSVAAELQRAASKESGLNRLRSHTNSFSALQQSTVYDQQAIASAANPQQPLQSQVSTQSAGGRLQQPSFSIGGDKTAGEDIQTTV